MQDRDGFCLDSEQFPPGLSLCPVQSNLAPPATLTTGLTTLLVYLFLGWGFLVISRPASSPSQLPGPLKTVRVVLGDDQMEDLLPTRQDVSHGGREPLGPEVFHLAAVTSEPTTPPEAEEFIRPPQDLSLFIPTVPQSTVAVAYGAGSGKGSSHGSGTGSGSNSEKGLFRSAEGPGEAVILEPRLSKIVKPDYPEIPRYAHIEGDVVVQLTADIKGVPVDFQIISGHPSFHDSVLKVLPRWRFEVVRQNGQAVQAVYRLVIRFTLQ